MRALIFALSLLAGPALAQPLTGCALPGGLCDPGNGRYGEVTADRALRVGPGAGTWTNRSTTITAGGTSQQLMAANTARRRVLVQNPCAATESIFLNWTAVATVVTATAGASIELAPCGSYDSGLGPVSTEAINVIATTTGHAVIAKEM